MTSRYLVDEKRGLRVTSVESFADAKAYLRNLGDDVRFPVDLVDLDRAGDGDAGVVYRWRSAEEL